MTLNTAAQSHLTLPWDGNNQKAQVSQWMGLVQVNITYFSPDVQGPGGEDRRGRIWGDLVPYNQGNPYPWRAGANRNTTISFSHDVAIEGQFLSAGTYGLHMIPSPAEWIVIFSHNATSWGSFTYKKEEDALRVRVTPRKAAAYAEWLTYEFVERLPHKTQVVLRWEDLEVPFQISADVKELFLENIRRELRDESGFTWESWYEAAKYCLENDINHEEALSWINRSISGDYFSNENAENLLVKAGLLERSGDHQGAQEAIDRALALGNADQLYQYGRQLMREDKNEEALEVFKLNLKQHKNAWPVHLGLGRGYRQVGDTKTALKHFKLALNDAPNDRQKLNIRTIITNLEQNNVSSSK